MQACRENLHASAVLYGQELFAEVNVILNVFHAHIHCSAHAVQVQNSADLVGALLAEIVIPYKMI